MATKTRTAPVKVVAWVLLLLGILAVSTAVVLVYPRDAEDRLWYPLFALAVVGALGIRSGVSLLRRLAAPRPSVPPPPAV